MKSINEELKDILSSDTINIVRCWKIELSNGNILGFSTNDGEFNYDGIKFNPLSADNIKTIDVSLDIKADEFKISNLISSELIRVDDILNGLYDNAKVEIFLIDISRLDLGKVSLLNGIISSIECDDNIFTANIKGLKNELNKTIGEIYSPLCRARFCDSKCGLTMANYEFNGTIDFVEDNYNFATNNEEIRSKNVGYFDNGIIEFMDGDNIGKKTEINQFSGGKFLILSELSYDLKVGDKFKVLAGCNKNFKSCCEKFNNAINFRGEPHLPGIELLLKIM